MACRFDLEAVEVKLLIGTHADALAPTAGSAAELETAEQPTWFQEAADWSIKHGFELIICCPTAPTVDAALALDGDRQGVARVVEALQAHMWPNLELLARGKEAAAEAAAAADASAGGPAVAAADEAADEDDTGAAAGSGYTALDGEEAAAGPASSRGRGAPSEAQAVPIAQTAAAAAAQAGPDAGSGTAKAAENGAAGKPAAAGVGAQPKGSAATKAGAAPGEEDMDDEEAEKVMEGLEKLMEEMRGHKDRLGVMSDEERRERAAELAMRMMAMMGGLEDESGEGEEDSEGE
ncbi:hypothetical protein HYH02_011173 [Chlamydomonas schloesseri]|uniref:Uncharacterized protein n=1 Tax=Chlamydomonas schloesseri TaxID=2026947 RepID=A0A835W336_9CHLO|nr:hypothetical protein HYH02_011173 [Chlamydomonas schloesseri]|eukprot:KAG2437530.1 hypothetical protein HYH02_011173 [Chlamydomonas schloesseri]